MAIAQTAPSTLRTECVKHPGSRVRLDGFVPSKWSDAHRRPRYRCVTAPKTRGHIVHPPGRRAAADRASPRLRQGLPELRARLRATRGRADRPRLRLRSPGDRAAVPPGGRGHEPARREHRPARVRLPGQPPRPGEAALQTDPGGSDQSPGEPRGQLPRRLRAGRPRRASSEDLAAGGHAWTRRR